MDTEAEIDEQSHQLLPDDLVLEIVARCGTIDDAIRCAATSKSLRRGILRAPFLRHLRGFLNNDGGRPTVLLGLYHQSADPHLQPPFVPASGDGGAKLLPPSLAALPSAPSRDGDSACDFGPYVPVASRRSLLVLRRRRCRRRSTAKEHAVELSVCNPTTGERRVLPPHDVEDMSHALLDVDPAPIAAPSLSSSFKLLVAELSSNNNAPTMLHVQIFSSEEDGWGPALACPITSGFLESRFKFGCSDGNTGGPRPVVVGDTVCWLCRSTLGDRILVWRWRGGGGVAGEAWIDDPPPGYDLGRREQCLAVLPSPADDAGTGSQSLLGLIAIEAGEIEVWACEENDAGSGWDWEWKLWHCIPEAAIPRPMGLRRRWLRGAELSWFCEGSGGTLFLRPRDGTVSPLLLSLDTMEVSKVDAREWELNPEPEFCPYEVDLLSCMLFVMKHF